MEQMLVSILTQGCDADARGRKVEPTISGIQSAIKESTSKPEFVLGEFLLARSNVRLANAIGQSSRIPISFLKPLVSIPLLDRTLFALGIDMARPPSVYLGSWKDHLLWGLDSVVNAVRMLLIGQTFGAAAIARGQLERWTANLASTNEIHQKKGEPTSQFFRRVWESYPLTRSTDAGFLFQELSEILHGRGVLVQNVRKENLGLNKDPFESHETNVILETLWLAGAQIRACICSLLPRKKGDQLFEVCQVIETTDFSALKEPLEIEPHFLTPLGYIDVFYLNPRSETNYATPGYAPLTPNFAALSGFEFRRIRALDFARRAYLREEQFYGVAGDPGRFEGRRCRQTFVSEFCACLELWFPNQEGARALSHAGSALRAAFILYLEDDDRLLVCLRTALELTARARTWRLKPGKATKIESAGSKASPRDWLQAAGWKRLSIFTKALGEMSHAWKPRWEAARAAIETVHPNWSEKTPSDPIESAALTMRGFALEQVRSGSIPIFMHAQMPTSS